MLRIPAGLRMPLALALFSAPSLAQGDNAFLRGQGRTDVAFTVGRDVYDEFWVGSTKVADPGVGEITRSTVNLWAAHGLRPDLDVFGSVTWAQSSSDGAAGFPTEGTLQDIVLGLKWLAYQGDFKVNETDSLGNFRVALAPSAKLPGSDYEDDAVTAIGDGQSDLRLRGIVQYQRGGVWAALESGYDIRNEDPADEVPLNLTLGFNIGEQITVMPFYSQVASRGGIDISDVPAEGGFPRTEEEFERAGVQLYGRLPSGWGWTAGYRATLDGKNTGDADAFWLGAVLSL